MQHGQRTVTLFDFFICDYTGSDDDDDDDESDSEYVTTDELPVVSCSLQQGLKQSVCVCRCECCSGRCRLLRCRS